MIIASTGPLTSVIVATTVVTVTNMSSLNGQMTILASENSIVMG